MRLGLLADVHERVENLAAAIDRCRREGAERLLLLGDVFETGARLTETIALLRESRIEGVWGNHEFGMCHEPDQMIFDLFHGPILDYMSRLRPRMEFAGVLLSHVLPCLDPTDFTQPWYVEGFPEDRRERRAQLRRIPPAPDVHRPLPPLADRRRLGV